MTSYNFKMAVSGRSPFTQKRILPVTIVGVYALASFPMARGFALTAFGDVYQALLLAACTAVFFARGSRSGAKIRLFWYLLSLGFGTWFLSQAAWTCYEVFLRQEVPNPFTADVVLFLHIVPIMAALAVRPQVVYRDQSAMFTSFDFLLLLVWWLYLYTFVVIPWQFDYLNVAAYGKSFDVLYLVEHLVLIACLLFARKNSSGAWRDLFSVLFWASLLYAASSITASVAIDFGRYYTGSLYDLPLVAAETWFLVAGLEWKPQQEAPLVIQSGSATRILPARVAMLAVFSTPVMVLWAAFGGNVPPAIRTFRLVLTASIMLVMGALIWVKQRLLDHELMALLQSSNESFEQMRRLKEDVENKEQQLRSNSVELQRKNVELQQASMTDTLTGIWNRRYLEEVLDSEVSQSLRHHYHQEGSGAETGEHRHLVFIMVDVDFFKHVNDDYGHAVGDELLRRVAERLSRVMRKSDVLIRWGGEEFLVLCRSAHVSGTPIFCERLLQVVADEPFVLGKDIRIRKTCSIGWAAFPWLHASAESLCAEEVIELADSALYLAKASGRNQGIGFVPSDAALANAATITVEDIREPNSGMIRLIKTAGPTTRQRQTGQDLETMAESHPNEVPR